MTAFRLCKMHFRSKCTQWRIANGRDGKNKTDLRPTNAIHYSNIERGPFGHIKCVLFICFGRFSVIFDLNISVTGAPPSFAMGSNILIFVCVGFPVRMWEYDLNRSPAAACPMRLGFSQRVRCSHTRELCRRVGTQFDSVFMVKFFNQINDTLQEHEWMARHRTNARHREIE